MALWPSEEPRSDGLRPRREYWIQGVPTRPAGRHGSWGWIAGGVVLLALSLGAAYYLPIHLTQIAGSTPKVAASEKSIPEHTPITAASSPPRPKLVVGLPHISQPSDQRGPEPHYGVGLRPITEQVPPPADPAAAALPPEAPQSAAPAQAKSSPNRALKGPSAHPTSGLVRF